MAIELEPWIQLVRGCCGVLVLVTAITPIPTLKLFGTGRSITNCNLNTLLFLFLALFFIYAAVFFRLVAEAVSRNSLPSIHAAFSETALVLATFMNAERLGDRDDKSPIHLNRAVSWCLLCAIELFVVVWTGLPGGQTSPPLASRVSAAIDVCKAATCVMILLQILPAIIANCNTASKPSPASPLDASSNPADILSLQMDTLREVEKLGGWWPFLKLFGVFSRYMFPVGEPVHQIRFVASFLLMVTHEVTELQEQLAFASILDAAATGSQVQTSFKKALLLRAVNTALSHIFGLLRAEIKLHRAESFATGVHAKILSMDPTFHSLANPTDLTKAVDDAKEFISLFDSIIFSHFINIMGIVMAATKLVSLHGPFLFIIMAYQITFTCVINSKGTQKRAEAFTKVHKLKVDQEHRRQDGLRGWTTLFNQNLIEHEIDCFRLVTGALIDQERKLDSCRLNFCLAQNIVSFCGVAAGYSFMIYRYGQGAATVGDLVLYTSVWATLWMRIGELTRTIPDLVDDLLDAAPLRRVLERSSAVQTSGAELLCGEGSLDLHDVSFTYPARDTPVVDHLSMSIKPGAKVALIGPSGTGKSTLLKLVMRYMSPSTGTILIDGQDISNIDKNSFHKSVGMMPQIPHIFNTTVMENVRMGKKNASDEEVYAACRRAMIHDTIIARPGGYESLMGENGSSFSGGEKQRIEFARLFLKQPKVVILDEPTSSLDPETEMQVLGNLINQFVHTTVIVVTHNVEIAKDFDRVILLGEGGKIVKDGSYRELLAKEATEQTTSHALQPGLTRY
ncbi:hypothetical protein MCOR27_010974 [Pyricularia oryzae]|nr:hypothetical protein MCOR19_004761 [Pyricularia oryzae]KAI6266572.1 hypothetical protein MCOR27_010974 [Pyricularia oryzae]KAI6286637.1 hypothetical protein MCOR26_001025 [Pyricularia oryzae]KAI6391567.1 hypothetical protein MCOR20_011331 [Pyricularia oryzae]KAI6399623.1 hypothetical protein MCOR23_005139 [Pyricularia oryzae]